jgi:hypothetical protein
MKAYWGSGGIAPRIFTPALDGNDRSALRPRPLYPQRKSPWYLLDSKMGGSQSRSGRVKVKVKLSLCFSNRAPRYEGVFAEWRYSSMYSLTSALDGGERSASRPSHFTPRETAPGTHWVGGWVGLQSRSRHGGEEKNASSRWESNSRTPIVRHVA